MSIAQKLSSVDDFTVEFIVRDIPLRLSVRHLDNALRPATLDLSIPVWSYECCVACRNKSLEYSLWENVVLFVIHVAHKRPRRGPLISLCLEKALSEINQVLILDDEDMTDSDNASDFQSDTPALSP